MNAFLASCLGFAIVGLLNAQEPPMDQSPLLPRKIEIQGDATHLSPLWEDLLYKWMDLARKQKNISMAGISLFRYKKGCIAMIEVRGKSRNLRGPARRLYFYDGANDGILLDNSMLVYPNKEGDLLLYAGEKMIFINSFFSLPELKD